jgi:hypothetical protein
MDLGTQEIIDIELKSQKNLFFAQLLFLLAKQIIGC